jgi:hypothetical protein
MLIVFTIKNGSYLTDKIATHFLFSIRLIIIFIYLPLAILRYTSLTFLQLVRRKLASNTRIYLYQKYRLRGHLNSDLFSLSSPFFG